MPNTQAQFGFKDIGYLGGGGAPDYQRNVTPLLVLLCKLSPEPHFALRKSLL